jgi:hypothetical protein
VAVFTFELLDIALFSVEETSNMVSELIAGFAIHVTPRTKSEWIELAGIFSSRACGRSSVAPVSVQRQLELQVSFLRGLQLSLKDFQDKDLAEHNSACILEKLKQKQNSVGLENAATMLLRNVMSSVRRTLKGYERRFEALPMPSQLLLEDGSDIDESGKCDGENDGMDVFEFDKDGIVL